MSYQTAFAAFQSTVSMEVAEIQKAVAKETTEFQKVMLKEVAKLRQVVLKEAAELHKVMSKEAAELRYVRRLVRDSPTYESARIREMVEERVKKARYERMMQQMELKKLNKLMIKEMEGKGKGKRARKRRMQQEATRGEEEMPKVGAIWHWRQMYS